MCDTEIFYGLNFFLFFLEGGVDLHAPCFVYFLNMTLNQGDERLPELPLVPRQKPGTSAAV